MTTGLYPVVVTLPQTTGVPEDDVQHTWHFENADDDTHLAVHTDIVAKLTTFYNTDLGASMTRAMGAYLGSALSRVANAASITSYFTDDFSGATPLGSPVGMSNFTLVASAGGTPFPAEIAVVLAFHADLTDVPETAPNPSPPPAVIRPAARHRSRVYWGPLENTASDGNPIPRVSATMRTDAAAACDNLCLGNDNLTTWCMWSKPDSAVRPIIGGFIDNAFDVQRRRGPVATTRTTWQTFD